MNFEEFRKKSLDISAQIADYRISNDDHERDIAMNNREIHKLEHELVKLQCNYELENF